MAKDLVPGNETTIKLVTDAACSSISSDRAIITLPAEAPGPIADSVLPTTARMTLPAFLFVSDVFAVIAAGALGAVWGGVRPAVFIVAVTLLVLVVRARYRWRFTLSSLDELPALVAAIGAATMIAGAAFAFLTIARYPEAQVISSVQSGLIIVFVATVGRSIAYAVARNLRRQGVGVANAVIVGSGDTARRLGAALTEHADFGVRLLGYVDVAPAHSDERRLLGTIEALPNVVRDNGVDLVLIAFPGGKCEAVVDPVRMLVSARCEVYVVPRLYELHDGAASGEIVGGVPLVQLRRLAFRTPSWRLKRVIDVVFASLAIAVALPVLAAVAVAVRLETGPGVIFKQLRIGRDGRPFTLYKFRSLKPAKGEDATRWNIDGDPRLGRVGVVIRSTSLDELPQLVNILRGDMSLVGPRPERPFFVEQFSATVRGYQHRHRMPVGLTGLAVVNGLRGDTGIPERANLDNLYAESWSLWLDTKIVLRTVSQVLPRWRWWRIKFPLRVRRHKPSINTITISGLQ